MNLGFWKNFPRPFFALAPLFDVTDTVFRRIIARCGKPDVMFTEFVSVDGLTSEKSRGFGELTASEKMIRFYLKFTKEERPLAAQLWGSDPEKFFKAAEIIQKLGFDGIDINMGCPDKKVVACGGGAGLIGQPALAKEIIAAAREGSRGLPVSVKTRIGFNAITLDRLLPALIEAKPAAITLHLRTKKEMSKVPAHWEVAAEAAKLCRANGVIVIGNGDVLNREDGAAKAEKYGLDGVMIGRGVFNNFWFFSSNADPKKVPISQKLALMLAHMRLFEKEFSGVKNFAMFRKHLQNYVNGFPGAKELRGRLMEAKTSAEAERIVAGFTPTPRRPRA